MQCTMDSHNCVTRIALKTGKLQMFIAETKLDM